MEGFTYFGLRGSRYPGRGILLGSTSAERAVLAYFIMGRSAGSRARAFFRDGDGLGIRLLGDGADPFLLLYAPIRTLEGRVIVSNGDQTDTIFAALKAGGSFEGALRTREYEPDAPHFTPRISGLLERTGYRLSILKREEGRCCRQFFEYAFKPGLGHLIHTYAGPDEAPLPPFAGEPRPVPLPDDLDALSAGLWDELDPENRVSLYVRVFRFGENFEDRIFNKYGEEE